MRGLGVCVGWEGEKVKGGKVGKGEGVTRTPMRDRDVTGREGREGGTGGFTGFRGVLEGHQDGLDGGIVSGWVGWGAEGRGWRRGFVGVIIWGVLALLVWVAVVSGWVMGGVLLDDRRGPER